MMMQPLVMAVLVNQRRADLARRADHARAVEAARSSRSPSRGAHRGPRPGALGADPVPRRFPMPGSETDVAAAT